MKSERVWRHFLLAFVLALAGYTVFYLIIEHRRTRKGPWEVTFARTPTGDPLIIIDQPSLGVSNVQVTLVGQTQSARLSNNLHRLVFKEPRPVPFDVPLGQCVFMDTTFLPGTVVLNVLGHEVQLLPRVLLIDRQERKWQSGARITLPPAQSAQ